MTNLWKNILFPKWFRIQCFIFINILNTLSSKPIQIWQYLFPGAETVGNLTRINFPYYWTKMDLSCRTLRHYKDIYPILFSWCGMTMLFRTGLWQVAGQERSDVEWIRWCFFTLRARLGHLPPERGQGNPPQSGAKGSPWGNSLFCTGHDPASKVAYPALSQWCTIYITFHPDIEPSLPDLGCTFSKSCRA